MQTDQEQTLLIRSPSREGTFEFSVPATASVAQIKDKLALVYPGNPSVDNQVLIHAGRILADSSSLSEVLKRHHAPGSPILHLVTATLSSSENAPQPQSQPQPQPQPQPRPQPRPPVQPQVPLPDEDTFTIQAPPSFLERQNWTLILKLAVVVYILSQSGPVSSLRLFCFILGAVLVYMHQIGLLRPARLPPAAAVGVNPAQAPLDPPPHQQQQPGPQDGPAPPRILSELQNVLLPLVCSLLPGWNPEAAVAHRPVAPPPAPAAMPAPGPHQHQD